ncbi:MAG: reverse gyrase [Desulfurococcales archaeon]|jgi:reverse gyrase|nr:reverse gyrase [Desulfurococcales archaeon]
MYLASNKLFLNVVYTDLCPVCGGPISSGRLSMGLPCSTCLPESEIPKNIGSMSFEDRIKAIASRLKGVTVYHYLSSLIDEYRELEKLLVKCIGKGFWSLQRTWAIRLLRNESFAITAPTGVGKTTLLLIYAVYMAHKGRKVYMLVPTENLVDQTVSKLSDFLSKTGIKARVLGYKSRVSARVKEEILGRIRSLDYDILVTTTAFLSRRFDLLRSSGARFDVVLVDDADSLLKNTGNIDKVLMLLGFTEEELRIAYELVKLKMMYGYALSIKSEDAVDIALKIEELSLKLNEMRGASPRGQLIIASATGRQIGLKPKLFKELLDFEIGSIQNYMRNVIDTYIIVKSPGDRDEKLLSIVRKLGRGGIILVSRDMGAGEARRITEYLTSGGVRATLALSGKRAVDKLVKGEVDVLVGVSSYYGTLVRGIDLPLHIKYVIFIGVPKTKIELRKGLQSPVRVLRIAASLASYIGEDFVNELTRTFNRLSPNEKQALRIMMMKNEAPNGESRLSKAYDLLRAAVEKIYDTAWRLLNNGNNKFLLVGTSVVTIIDNQLYLIVPDPLSYIQASGRTSRFINNGMTLGLAVTLETSEELVESLRRRLEWYLYEFSFRGADNLDFEAIRKELDKSREDGSNNLLFKPARAVLIVVESPTKAKTIASFFGRPARRRFGSRVLAYETPIIDAKTREAYLGIIIATRGHVYDLVSDEKIGLHGVVLGSSFIAPVYASIKKCLKCGEQFSSLSNKCPKCGEERKLLLSRDVALSLRALAFEVEEVLLATDPDSEGEKIAWDIYNVVAPFSKIIRRIEFHEVTKDAIIQALREPRSVNENKVLSQVFRRITDRWIGFSSSEKLWEVFDKRWLGSGRVQVPVLGWIINRYNSWKASRGYVVKIKLFQGPVLRKFYHDKNDASSLVEEANRIREAEIVSYKDEVKQAMPQPPLTTDELLLLANYKLGLPSSTTMKIAQELFESGLITYHRTDSTRVSTAGIGIARHYITNVLGKPEWFAPRTWGEGGAHEAIRPTQPISPEELWRRYMEGLIKTVIPLTPLHIKLYDLIFRRFMSSQMKPSMIVETELKMRIGRNELSLTTCTGVIEDGFTSVWPLDCHEQLRRYIDAGRIPIESVLMERGSEVTLFKEGEVVRLMKEKKIGRPSTYAKTISSLKKHGYIIESRKARFLVPTRTGIEVYDYLMRNYSSIFAESRTAELEESLRKIEEKGVGELALLMNSLLIELREYGLVSEERQLFEPLIVNPGLRNEIESLDYSLSG